MVKKDIGFILLIIILFLPFIVLQSVYDFYIQFNSEHGIVMAFLKFALLATLGEVIGLRIRKGVYHEKYFGILPRAIVWGFLGITIKLAFVLFASGTPALLEYLGMENSSILFRGELSWAKVGVAFSISMAMNLIYAPIMMTVHKITDTHIIHTKGSLKGFFSPIPIRNIFVNLNWEVMWNFVFKKTIPFFWIPAHTITFLLAPDFQVLFAAILGIALGVILAIADLSNEKMK